MPFVFHSVKKVKKATKHFPGGIFACFLFILLTDTNLPNFQPLCFIFWRVMPLMLMMMPSSATDPTDSTDSTD